MLIADIYNVKACQYQLLTGVELQDTPQRFLLGDRLLIIPKCFRMVEQNSVIAITATEEELAILNNITPNSLGDGSFVDSGISVKPGTDKTGNDSNDKPGEIIEENPVNLLKEWQGRVYKFDGNTDSPSPVDINNNLDNENNKDFELVGIVNLGSNIRENSDGRYGINNANWGEGSVKGNSKLPKDNFLVKAYTEVDLEGGKTYEFEARGDDKYQIWLKNLDTEEWSWVTKKDEWKSTVGMEKDTTIKNSYTIPSDKGGRYYVGFFHYENDQEAYFGLNWKEKDIDDKPDKPGEIIEENPVNLLKEWQGRVYKFDGNTDSPSPVDINNNLDNENNKDFELVGIVNLGSNIRENSDGRYGINNANWGEGSVKGNSKLPKDNFLVKAYTEVDLEGGKTYEFEARGDDKYQIWLKNLDTEEWSWVTKKDEWKSTVGMEKDTTIKNSYTIPSDKGGRYYVGFFHYENDQEAYFGLNWKEKDIDDKPDVTTRNNDDSESEPAGDSSDKKGVRISGSKGEEDEIIVYSNKERSGQVSLYLYDKDGKVYNKVDNDKDIEGEKNTILVIHGWNDNTDAGYWIDNLSKKAAELYEDKGYQVLALDWSQHAKSDEWPFPSPYAAALSITPYPQALSITPVAKWTQNKLKDLGIKRENLTLFGHSLGSLVSSEIGRLFEKVKNIVALDPPILSKDYDIDGDTGGDQSVSDFKDVAERSLSFVLKDTGTNLSGFSGSSDMSATAEDSLLIEYIGYSWKERLDLIKAHKGTMNVFKDALSNKFLTLENSFNLPPDLSDDQYNRFVMWSPEFFGIGKPMHEGVVTASIQDGTIKKLTYMNPEGLKKTAWIKNLMQRLL